MLVNTRPSDLAPQLGVRLAELGVDTLALPLLQIERKSVQVDAALTANYRVLLCVSPRAAEFFLKECSAEQLSQLRNQVWVAVGSRTASVLRLAGFNVQVPRSFNSESLLALPEFSELSANQKVLILRGAGGRKLIDDTLQARGVEVRELVLYTRRAPTDLARQWQCIKSKRPTHLLISSFEAWQNFAQVESDLIDYRYLLLGTRLQDLVADPLALAHARRFSEPAQTFDLTNHTRTVSDLSPETIAEAYLTWI